MARNDVRIFVCPNGHEVSNVYGGTVPLACPAYIHGLPCGLALKPKYASRASTTTQVVAAL